MTQVELRLAQPAQAAAACELYLLSRRTFLPYAPVMHSPAEVQGWFESVLVPRGVWLAWVEDQLAGLLVLDEQDGLKWIDQLYLHPGFTGRGLGSQLVDFAKQHLGSPIQLYTFQQNLPARRFYERHGFIAMAFGDGSGNEENCPDVLYRWESSSQ